MEKATLGRVQLEYETHGSGEPVILIHGSVVADSYAPMMTQPSLDRYQLVRYRRRGFGGSTHPASSVSIAEQAVDCLALMNYLKIPRAHVAGHSYGGVIALQLALDHADAVHSLALLEPALVGLIPDAAAFSQAMAPVMKQYSEGDKSGALGAFLGAVVGPDFRKILERVPGAYEMALADADNFFRVEMPALGEWRFSREDGQHIRQPVLSVLGMDSAPIFHEIQTLVQSWFEHAHRVAIAGVNHMLQMIDPRAVAEALGNFFTSCPMR
jgi:pimeloyl-ACP methyl ester carboxylesterase